MLTSAGRLRCYLWGFLGGLGGSLALLALLALGLAPFVRILLNRG